MNNYMDDVKLRTVLIYFNQLIADNKSVMKNYVYN